MIPRDAAPLDSSGFTIMEVLVALLVIGLATAALLPELQVSRSATERAKERILLAGMANTLLDRIGTSIPLQPGTVAGVEAAGLNAVAWRITIAREEAGRRPEALPDALRLFRVRLTLGLQGEAGAPFRLVTLRAAP